MKTMTVQKHIAKLAALLRVPALTNYTCATMALRDLEGAGTFSSAIARLKADSDKWPHVHPPLAEWLRPYLSPLNMALDDAPLDTPVKVRDRHGYERTAHRFGKTWYEAGLDGGEVLPVGWRHLTDDENAEHDAQRRSALGL